MNADALLQEICLIHQQNVELIHRSSSHINLAELLFRSRVFSDASILSGSLQSFFNQQSLCASVSPELEFETVCGLLQIFPNWIRSADHLRALKNLKDIILSFGKSILQEDSLREVYRDILTSIATCQESCVADGEEWTLACELQEILLPAISNESLTHNL